jgi:hypothetical protein
LIAQKLTAAPESEQLKSHFTNPKVLTRFVCGVARSGGRMPEDSLSDVEIPITCTLHNLTDSEKPTIRILLYTDDPQEVVEQTGPGFGLGVMISHLRSRPPAFANLWVKLVSRYPQGSDKASNKINIVLEEAEKAQKPFDQVWVFGLHQINKQRFSLGIGGGGPESELDRDEVSALRTRMDAGLGVLVTGDHANERPEGALDNPESPIPDDARNEQFLGLGRALGRSIPRAGMLRDWEGKPTANPRHSFNTQVIAFGTSLTQIGFQKDPIPQQLILKTFNERGKPSFEGRPHPLFFYRQGTAILLYPDHLHEGAVTLPAELDEKLWPKTIDGFQPQPRIVAHGVDKRNARKLKLIAVYDGDAVNAGRIVADSTWHHYFNVNLREFPPGSAPLTPADQIGQYYANLALWLSPLAKRAEMADAMSRWLERQPEIAEVVGPQPSSRNSDVLMTGSLAMKYLAEVASDCEVHELLQLIVPRSTGKRYESLYFPDESSSLSPLPSKELLLGLLIHKTSKEPTEMLTLEALSEARLTFRRDAIMAASAIAFKRQRRRVELTAQRSQRLFPDT